MSDLQIAMIGVGVALVALVAIYNVAVERRARKAAEKAFGERPGDALFEGERREPTLGAIPAGDEGVPPSTPLAPLTSHLPPAAQPLSPDLEAGVAPSAEISTRIDTVAVILADDPITRDQLELLLEALRGHATPVHVEGIVDEQWHPIESSPRSSWRELRVALQLASRAGPVSEEEIDEFNRAVADFSASMNAVSQREAPAAAAQRARELDHFCAETDIEVAVNVIGQFGATFSLSRVKSIALEHGLSETAEGALVRYGRDGSVQYAVRRFGDDAANPPASYTHGLTLALDLPQVPDAPTVFAEMVQLGHGVAQSLGGQLVDDNRRPLTDAGLHSILRTVEKVSEQMEQHGIPPGSAAARRLFS